MNIRCGNCTERHASVNDVQRCYFDNEDEAHFCESPSCMVERGCAGYKHWDAAFMTTEEERLERQGWAHWDAEMAASDRWVAANTT